MAIRLSRVVLRCFPILLAAAFLPAPFNITLPPGWLSGVLFLASVTFGFLVLISFSMLIYISAFYTISPMGIRILATSVIEFFAGAIIPIPFFPGSPAADSVCAALCFHAKYAVSDLYRTYKWLWKPWRSIAAQLVWLAALMIAGRILMKRALKKGNRPGRLEDEAVFQICWYAVKISDAI